MVQTTFTSKPEKTQVTKVFSQPPEKEVAIDSAVDIEI